MPRRRTPPPTDAELAILGVLWRTGPATVREVHEGLPASVRRGYTTTLKLMQIMAGKGLVSRDESRRSHVYRALVKEQATRRGLVRELADKAFEGSAARLALSALGAERASAEELAELRKLLDELESRRRR